MAIGEFTTEAGTLYRWKRKADGTLACQTMPDTAPANPRILTTRDADEAYRAMREALVDERYSTRLSLGTLTWDGEDYQLSIAIKGTQSAPESVKLFRLLADGTRQEMGDEFTARLALFCYAAGKASA